MTNIRENLLHLIGQVQDWGIDSTDVVETNSVDNEVLADHLLDNGVTLPESEGCDYCQEDIDGFRRMLGAFSITNPFHGSVWNIETCHCKPRQIYFCPMCGRKLEGV